MNGDDLSSPILARRQILRRAGALGLLGLGLGRYALARTADDLDEPELDLGDLADDARFQSMCVLTPSTVQGPYYLNLNLVRSDITEGLPGLKTHLSIYVVHASDCSPIQNASVDVWHCDAFGKYSGIASQGTAGLTFLRGVQFTDASGLASFDTIYPGWYPSRTTHLHVKVHPSGSSVLTTQLYSKQALSNRVYSRPPYSTQGPSPTTNSMDPFFLPETVMQVLGFSQGVLHLELVIGVA